MAAFGSNGGFAGLMRSSVARRKPAAAPVLDLDDESILDAARMTQQRAKRRAAGGGSKRSTLLTGPSGLADVPMQPKTLLGS